MTTDKIVARKLADSRPIERRKKHGRSRVSNGNALLPGDNRSSWVRRCRDVIADHISDLGGLDNTSAAERSIVRRAAVLTVELERLEAHFAVASDAKAGDLDLYQRTAGNLRRLLETIGLQRRAKPVGMTLGEAWKIDQEEQQRAREQEQQQ
jgi:hypothetical protein